MSIDRQKWKGIGEAEEENRLKKKKEEERRYRMRRKVHLIFKTARILNENEHKKHRAPRRVGMGFSI